MNRKAFVGRYQECDRLERCLKESQAQLIIVYGRRRVGKTFLINRFFEGRFDFRFTGAYDQPREVQLRNFSLELNRQWGREGSVPKDWTCAFDKLRSYLESLPEGEKRVVFLDEMPWMDTQRSGFLPAFEWFWNDWGASQEDLVFVVCGSATSWMVDNIAHNKGGLFNRQTCRLWLEPFTLRETEEYLAMRGMEWSRYDIAECYMIMGGYPYYLRQLEPERSFPENIDNLFFRKRAELWDEFDHLYRTLFAGSEQYVQVVEALSKKRSGMTRQEVAARAGLSMNGNLSKILNNLADAGFVRISRQYGGARKETVYQLADYYTLFYYRFIKGNYGRDERFWSNMLDNPSRRAWAGLTFEMLCRDHIPQIKKKLGIAGVLSEEYSWSGRAGAADGEEAEEDGAPGAGKAGTVSVSAKMEEESAPASADAGGQGAQIDLLIDRRDRIVNVCEIKFSMDLYEINKDYDEKLRNKIETFRRAANCRKTIQLTMITTYGVKRNKYSSRIVSQVVLDDLFSE